jgi:hypothetical protein
MPKENRSTVNKSNRHLFSAISSSTSPSESTRITCHEKPVDLTKEESDNDHSVSEVPTDDELIPLEVRLTTISNNLKDSSDSENSNHQAHDIIPPRMPVLPVKHDQADTYEPRNTSALFQVADYSSDSD